MKNPTHPDVTDQKTKLIQLLKERTDQKGKLTWEKYSFACYDGFSTTIIGCTIVIYQESRGGYIKHTMRITDEKRNLVDEISSGYGKQLKELYDVIKRNSDKYDQTLNKMIRAIEEL